LNPWRPRTFPRLYRYSANFHRRPVVTGHDEDVIQMNGNRKSDSGRVQRAAASVACMIGERHHRNHKHIGLHKTHAKHIASTRMTPAAKRS
jgi:hypothetical protein